MIDIYDMAHLVREYEEIKKMDKDYEDKCAPQTGPDEGIRFPKRAGDGGKLAVTRLDWHPPDSAKFMALESDVPVESTGLPTVLTLNYTSPAVGQVGLFARYIREDVAERQKDEAIERARLEG